MDSIGDLARSLVLRNNQMRLRDDMDRLAVEVTTGIVKDAGRHLGGDVTGLIAMDRALSRLEVFRITTTEAAFLSSAMQAALGGMQERSEALSATLSSASLVSTESLLDTMSADARDAFAQSLDALNTSAAGRHLFSGTAVNRPALQGIETMLVELRASLAGATDPASVEAALNAFFADGGAFETSVYTGSDIGLTAMRLSETETASLDIRATDPVFREFLKPLAMATMAGDPALGFDRSVRVALLSKARTDLLAAQNPMVDLRAQLGLLEIADRGKQRAQCRGTICHASCAPGTGRDRPVRRRQPIRERAFATRGSLCDHRPVAAPLAGGVPLMRLILLLLCGLLAATFSEAQSVRIKDLVEVDGVRANDLVGYGLVVGLNGTGDGLRNAPFTEEIMSNILERLGVNVTGEQFRPRNVAAVFVTGRLPPFARAGSQIDVTISAIGDSKSLLGGTLIMTPLNAADGQIYAVAQGTVIAGGAEIEGDAARIVQGVPTAGVIPSGARVEREVAFDFTGLSTLRLALREPDFTTAARIEDVINRAIGRRAATMLDAGTISVDLARTGAASPARAVVAIENLTVEPERRARVVVDQRSGTIVMGADVRISRVAVSQGNLTLRIEEAPLAVQPNPFAEGETVIVPRTGVGIEEEPGIGLAEVPGGTSLSEVIAGLNALGVSPRDMIDILKSIKAAGALHADFVVM